MTSLNNSFLTPTAEFRALFWDACATNKSASWHAIKTWFQFVSLLINDKSYHENFIQVTLPSTEMKRAMIEAPLGDDVYGEDPTVIKLEQRYYLKKKTIRIP